MNLSAPCTLGRVARRAVVVGVGDPPAAIAEAADLLGAEVAVLVDGQRNVRGTLSRDQLARGRSPSTRFLSLDPEVALGDAFALLAVEPIEHILVVARGELLGAVTQVDIENWWRREA
jgi:CBS domain-containing protein